MDKVRARRAKEDSARQEEERSNQDKADKKKEKDKQYRRDQRQLKAQEKKGVTSQQPPPRAEKRERAAVVKPVPAKGSTLVTYNRKNRNPKCRTRMVSFFHRQVFRLFGRNV
jgi:hypothetical protein